MNEYSFMLVFKNQDMEPVFMECGAEDWKSPVAKEKIINIFAREYVQNYLSHAFCLYGHLFDPRRHSPQKLYEALCANPEWEVSVEGINCELPDNLFDAGDLPDNAIS